MRYKKNTKNIEKNPSSSLSILSNISRSLKPGAKALPTVLNGAAKLCRASNEDVSEGRFDPLTMIWSSEFPPRVAPSRPGPGAGFLADGAVPHLPPRWDVRGQHVGRDRRELGAEGPRSGRDGDHDRGPQDLGAVGYA
jgi:hypothetical protein